MKRFRDGSYIGSGEYRNNRSGVIIIPSEYHEHIAFVQWLEIYPQTKGFFFHPANGGSRSPKEGFNFKRQGVSPGIPDIVICIPKNGYHGLFIELKRRRRYKITPYQLEWQQKLRSQGYKSEIAIGFDEAKRIVEEYFNENIGTQRENN